MDCSNMPIDFNQSCDKFGKDFASKKGLWRHISTVHEGNKPQDCDACEKSFAEKTNLESHKATVHM